MGTKLYVGNLSFNTSESLLNETFAGHGSVVSAKLIMDRDTGRSKGFGFIEMGSSDEAQAAISSLNGTELDGRSIKVNEAKERERSFGGGDRGGRW